MDVKEAVRVAKQHIADLFQDERVVNIGLEEVEFDAFSNRWLVTIGFSRPWDRSPTSPLVAAITAPPEYRRSMKIVSIDDQGKIQSVKDRQAETA